MKPTYVRVMLAAGALFAAVPGAASSQVSVGLHLSWHWSDDGWRPSRIADGYVAWHDGSRVARVRPSRVHVAPVRFRVPPGHMPPPGMCRLWVVGRPPGHQPRPEPCARLFRVRPRPGVVVLHTPARGDRWWRDGRWERGGGWRWDDGGWDDDDRWGRDRDRRGRGRGRGPRG